MLRILLVLWIGMLLSDCKSQKTHTATEKDISKEALYTTWYYHSVNEKNESVFVSDDSDLPPARFREKLTFEKEANRVSKKIPGPTDRPETIYGNWQWIGKNQLILIFEGAPNDTLTIDQLSDKELTFKLKN